MIATIPDLQAVLSRLEKLERQNRFQRAGLVAVVALLGGVLLANLAGNRRIEGQEFLLKDTGGTVRAKLQVEPAVMQEAVSPARVQEVSRTSVGSSLSRAGHCSTPNRTISSAGTSAGRRGTLSGIDLPGSLLPPPENLIPHYQREQAQAAPSTAPPESAAHAGTATRADSFASKLGFHSLLAELSNRVDVMSLARRVMPGIRASSSVAAAPSPGMANPIDSAGFPSLPRLEKFRRRREAQPTRNPFEFAANSGPGRSTVDRLPASAGTSAIPVPEPSLSDTPAAAAIAGPSVLAVPAPGLKALGYSQTSGSTSEAVVSDDINIYVVHEGDYFADRYRVITVEPTFIEILDGSTNQTLRLSYTPNP